MEDGVRRLERWEKALIPKLDITSVIELFVSSVFYFHDLF